MQNRNVCDARIIQGLYNFRDAEKVDGIAESSQKNDIYCITRIVSGICQIRMNKSKVSQYT